MPPREQRSPGSANVREELEKSNGNTREEATLSFRQAMIFLLK